MIIGIRFNDLGKLFYVKSDIDVDIKEKVIIEFNKALFLVSVNEIKQNYDGDIKGKVVRLATQEDYDNYLNSLSDARNACLTARKIARDFNLNMNIINAYYSLDKTQIVSNERVDFREFVKILASKFRTRIELYQIGVRDKASIVGGIGFCGRKLCCNDSLKSIESVNINMVKNQNIALNPSKINGACGRLLCCFNYENDIYETNKKDLPKVNEKVVYKGKKCIVESINVLNREYTVVFDDMTKEIVKVK